MATFDLRVHFEGLMMWVPEDDKAMHVLMPAIKGHNNHKKKDNPNKDHPHGKKHDGGEEEIPEHLVRVMVDQAYTRQGEKQLSRDYFMVDLAGRVLDLTGLSWDGLEMSLPDEIPSIDEVVKPLDRRFVRGKPTAPVASRVSIDAGAMTNYALGTPFTFIDPQTPRRITGVTEWTIRGLSSRKPRAMGGDACLLGTQILAHEDGKTDLPDLYPIGNMIHLTVMHLVKSDFPPHSPRFNPKEDEPDFHFDAYFDVVESTMDEPPEPPEPAKVRDILVDGDRVDDDSGQIPGSICGTVTVSLAAA